MRKLTAYIGVIAIALLTGISGTPAKQQELLICFYNVENLFDTLDNPHANDNDFLPDGKKEWNSERYWEKIDRIGQVLMATGNGTYPNLIGLCEIENHDVLLDLTTGNRMKNGNYAIIHHESPDHRGIDVALLYQPTAFEPLHQQWYELLQEDQDKSSTREILYAKGLVYKKDTLHVLVNHWPSRVGGEEETAPKRWQASQLLFSVIDSIIRINPNAKVVVLGDFNDTHNNESVDRFLTPKDGKDQLWLLNHAFANNLDNLLFPGTYNYKDNWDLLDHIMISKGITDSKAGINGKKMEAGIFVEDWMLYTSDNGKQYPNRSYGGSYYYGGYSDHLPVWVKLCVK